MQRFGVITPRSLLSHTSGAADGFGFPGYDPSAPRPTLIQILNGQPPSITGPVRFVRAPFQWFQYSGGGYVVLQQALHDFSGRPFDAFMRETVLNPLGMRHSSFQQPMDAHF